MDRRLLAASLLILAFLGGRARASDVVGEIVAKLSETVDPCEDMYNYSCENYIKKNEIPDGEFILNEAHVQFKGLLDRQAEGLLTDPLGEDAFPIDKELQNFYKSCMEDEGFGSVLMGGLLQQIGGWPVVVGDEWKADSWFSLVQKFSKYGLGIDYLFRHHVLFDDETKSGVVGLDRPRLILNDDYGELKRYPNGTLGPRAQAYLKYAIKIAKLFGASQEQAEKDMKKVLEFEFELLKAFSTKAEKRILRPAFKRRTVASVPWGEHKQSLKEYLDALFEKSGATSSPVFTDKDIVKILDIHYFELLFKALHGAGSRTVANYLILRAVHSSVVTGSIGSDALQALKDFQGSPSRFKRCIRTIGFDGDSPQAAAASQYARFLVTPEKKKKAQQIVDEVKEEYRKTLSDATWMDEETHSKALDELSKVGVMVGSPDELLDRGTMEGYFVGLQYSKEVYFENTLAKERFEIRRKFEGLPENRDRHHWTNLINVVYPIIYYSNHSNYLIVPATNFQRPFFSPAGPDFVNYGGLGTSAAHALSDGLLKNLWLQLSSLDAFKQKEECVIDHYSKYFMAGAGVHVNGSNTRETNLADIEAAKVAFQAYKKSLGAEKVSEIVEGTSLTRAQLFWIKDAQLSCIKLLFDSIQGSWIRSWDVFPSFKVQGVASNNAEFARVFNCPADSKMNPSDKCFVW